ncbi:uncharacterized protein B0I36DRAFT_321694 [Microdochium trichocladiopsis]|uniref:Secreted protein n=1 Tax=Microdochium trichocladiopsis TaxID=1682393 RepID=A0A9P8YAG2_9PEZI|nr:uncharacterized protein B0I36DRAFT_321694 [Microdochium trichocladiopsis]KAH7033571.1 hypothetical protein B0I36DRAFT_321694 [Microdochium trichocladiopsis]
MRRRGFAGGGSLLLILSMVGCSRSSSKPGTRSAVRKPQPRRFLHCSPSSLQFWVWIFLSLAARLSQRLNMASLHP